MFCKFSFLILTWLKLRKHHIQENNINEKLPPSTHYQLFQLHVKNHYHHMNYFNLNFFFHLILSYVYIIVQTRGCKEFQIFFQCILGFIIHPKI
jgi:hypothetical protein